MTLTEFTQYFDLDRAEIILLNENIALAGEPADFFYAFCLLGNELYSLNARHPVSSPWFNKISGREEFKFHKISLKRYSQTDIGFEVVEQKELITGTDPRIVSNGEKAYGIITIPFSNGNKAVLYDLTRQRLSPIEIGISPFSYGKNWQPFLIGEELFVVHELTPFRVLRINVETGSADIIREDHLYFNLPAFHQPYPMLRGGANAAYCTGTLFGIGRATSQRYRHLPFFWSKNTERGGFQVIFSDFFYPFYKAGYNIVDPTSFFFKGSDVFLGLCCTERDWVHTQLVSHFLIALRDSKKPAAAQRLRDFFTRRAITEEQGEPNLDRHMFFCVEMMTEADGVNDSRGRASVGKGGYLVRGPNVVIPRGTEYCAELSYLTTSCPPGRAGAFEVTINRLQEDLGDGHHQVLGQVDLAATEGHMREARIQFDTTGCERGRLEMRVWVEKDVKMIAYHIRTWRVDHHTANPTTYPWSPL